MQWQEHNLGTPNLGSHLETLLWLNKTRLPFAFSFLIKCTSCGRSPWMCAIHTDAGRRQLSGIWFWLAVKSKKLLTLAVCDDLAAEAKVKTDLCRNCQMYNISTSQSLFSTYVHVLGNNSCQKLYLIFSLLPGDVGSRVRYITYSRPDLFVSNPRYLI